MNSAPNPEGTQPWKKEKNINSAATKPPPWNPNDVAGSVDRLYDYVEGQAAATVRWYYRNKARKALWSQVCRFGTIVFTALGGIIPVVVAAYANDPLQQLKWNQLGYASIGLAALFLALDRFAGSSSGWMRYIESTMRLETLIEDFRLDWLKLKAALGNAVPDGTSIAAFLDRLKSFTLAARAEVEKETQAWIGEFRTNLQQLEKETSQALDAAREQARKDAEAAAAAQRAAAEASRSGAIDVTLKTNGGFDGGIAIELDGEVRRQNITGLSCGIANVDPGLHEIAARGLADGKPHHVSKVVAVEGNKVVSVTLELN